VGRFKEKILVVDCEIDIGELISQRLTFLGYEVILAVNGEDAISLFTEQKPDLIILEKIENDAIKIAKYLNVFLETE
jgi:CheY-like chemotaxis protein